MASSIQYYYPQGAAATYDPRMLAYFAQLAQAQQFGTGQQYYDPNLMYANNSFNLGEMGNFGNLGLQNFYGNLGQPSYFGQQNYFNGFDQFGQNSNQNYYGLDSEDAYYRAMPRPSDQKVYEALGEVNKMFLRGDNTEQDPALRLYNSVYALNHKSYPQVIKIAAAHGHRDAMPIARQLKQIEIGLAAQRNPVTANTNFYNNGWDNFGFNLGRNSQVNTDAKAAVDKFVNALFAGQALLTLKESDPVSWNNVVVAYLNPQLVDAAVAANAQRVVGAVGNAMRTAGQTLPSGWPAVNGVGTISNPTLQALQTQMTQKRTAYDTAIQSGDFVTAQRLFGEIQQLQSQISRLELQTNPYFGFLG